MKIKIKLLDTNELEKEQNYDRKKSLFGWLFLFSGISTSLDYLMLK